MHGGVAFDAQQREPRDASRNQSGRIAVPAWGDVALKKRRLTITGDDYGLRGESSEPADGSYTDEWGVTYKPGPETIDHPVGGPIKTLTDAQPERHLSVPNSFVTSEF